MGGKASQATNRPYVFIAFFFLSFLVLRSAQGPPQGQCPAHCPLALSFFLLYSERPPHASNSTSHSAAAHHPPRACLVLSFLSPIYTVTWAPKARKNTNPSLHASPIRYKRSPCPYGVRSSPHISAHTLLFVLTCSRFVFPSMYRCKKPRARRS